MPNRQASPKNTVGELIRAARQARKLTLRAVAEATNTTHGFIADLELGRRNASDEVLSRVAAAVGIAARTLHRANAAEKIARLRARIEELQEASR
jgi:transcriptional regulator with XRE-family HTH domain